MHDSPAAALDQLLAPRELTRVLGHAQGAHLRATTRFFAKAQAAPDAGFMPAQDVTTETELWLDSAGDYRLVETNDQDGGREIVRKGNLLFVALRYGKSIWHVAREPEIGRYLEEAVGGPFAAWELARAAAAVTVEPHGTTHERFTIALATTATGTPSMPVEHGLRAWRTRTRFSRLAGAIVRRVSDGLVESAELEGAFVTTGDTARPEGPADAAPEPAPTIAGGFAVRLVVLTTGAEPAIESPDAEPLPVLQRSLLEERLLDGLPGRRDPARTASLTPAPTRTIRRAPPPAHLPEPQ